MVDWKAAFSGKTVDQIATELSQLPDDTQQELQQALQLQGNSILIAHSVPPQPPQSWRLVLLNNKDRTTFPIWGRNWPHQLAHQREGGAPNDNTLFLVQSVLTHVRVGLLPPPGHGHGANQPANVTISLHWAPNTAPAGLANAPITAAVVGGPIFVTRSGVAIPTTQALTAPSQKPEQPLHPQPPEPQRPQVPPNLGLLQHVQELHNPPQPTAPMLQARLAALTQANADSQTPGLRDTDFKFCFSITPRELANGDDNTQLFLRFTLHAGPNDPWGPLTVDTEPFQLRARKSWGESQPPKENVGANEPPKQKQKTDAGGLSDRAGTSSLGAGPSSLGAGPSGSGAAGPSGSGLPEAAPAPGPEAEDSESQFPPEVQLQVGVLIDELEEALAALPEAAAATSGPGAATDAQEDAPGPAEQTTAGTSSAGAGASSDGAMTDEQEEQFLASIVSDSSAILVEFSPGNQQQDGGEDGGAGFANMGAGGDDSGPVMRPLSADDSGPSFMTPLSADDSGPSFMPCSAPDESGAGGAFRSLATSGGNAGGEAGLTPQQSAIRRARRARRDTAMAQLLAILRAASAQQQQQPGATPLAQLKEELEDLKAWLGL